MKMPIIYHFHIHKKIQKLTKWVKEFTLDFFQVWFLFKLHSKYVSKYVGTHSSTVVSNYQRIQNKNRSCQVLSSSGA